MTDTDIHTKGPLFVRIKRKKKMLDNKRPLSKDALSKLREEIRLAHTYHSNAIEGNTLTLQETKLVIEEGMTVGGKSLKEHLEATGNAWAFDRAEELAQGRRKIDQVIVQEIHELITKGQLMKPGQYRTHNVMIGGATKKPPNFKKIVNLMDDLFDDLKGRRDHRIVVATYIHHRLVEIHPFTDGNGRVARLMMNLYLMRYGYPPIVLKKENRWKYYECLRKADRGDLRAFVEFVAKAVDESLTIYLSMFGGKNELMPLKELAKGSPYSQEYLSLRARQGILDAVKMGKAWHSTQRALEEYIEIHGRG